MKIVYVAQNIERVHDGYMVDWITEKPDGTLVNRSSKKDTIVEAHGMVNRLNEMAKRTVQIAR